MPNLKYLHLRLRLVPMTLAMVTIAAWGQAPATLTVNEVLKQQQAALTPPPVLKVERAKTIVTLDAVYGLSDRLKFDVTINGLARTGLAPGETAKGSTGSCTIVKYIEASQCLQLGQGARTEICPAQACWSGVRLQATLLPSTSTTVIPAISSLQPLPPQPARIAQSGVISIAPAPVPTHALQPAGAKP